MNQNEQARLKVLNSVMVGQLPVAQAAELLRVSERHVWRVLAAYRREGAAALVHGNRGRRPANATSEAAIADVLRLATTRYSGTNHTHLSELLMEREGIALSRSTVRRIALSAGVRSPRRRRSPRHRVRRRRMPQAGMLGRSTAATIGGWRNAARASRCYWPWTMRPARRLTRCSKRKRTREDT